VRIRPKFVRDRLTLWYIAVIGAILCLYICAALGIELWQLTSQIYHAEIQDVETVEGLLYFTPDGSVGLHEEYHNYPQNRLMLDRLMEVFATDGSVVFRSEKLHGRDLGSAPFPGEGNGQSVYNERSLRLQDGTRVLVISHVHRIQSRVLLIRLAYPTEPLLHRLTESLLLLLLPLPIVLIVSGFAGYRVAGKALSPLEKMTSQAEQITANRLHDRIAVENPDDELGHMARVLNSLLQRLEDSFQQLKNFTSNVSHDLRTPLATVRSVGEVGLQADRSNEEYREIIGSMLEETTRLSGTIDTLLTLARADAGQINLDKSTFPLIDLVEECVEIVSVMAEQKMQRILVSGDRNITINADRSILWQAIMNVLDNAVKHSNQESVIAVSIQSLPKSTGDPVAELVIADSGPGISAEDSERIFDRFYRADSVRYDGSGLGLSIAKWAVELHAGQIGLRSSDHTGSVFYIQVPLAPYPIATS
jgi:heavy metal sensor kinase